MPGPLTWRNVDAPKFDTSVSDYARIGAMLDGAFSKASDALGNFDKMKSDAVNNGIMMALAKYQDPAAAEAALANGEIFNLAGPKNAYRVNTDTIQAAMGRPTQLLDQVSKTISNKTSQSNLDWTTQARANDVAMAPIMAKLAEIKVDPSNPQAAMDARTAILQDPAYAPVLSKLHSDQFDALVKFGNYNIDTPIKRDQSVVTLNTDKFDLGEKKSDAATRKAAANLYARVAAMASTPDEARALVAASGENGEVQTATLNMLNPSFPGLVGTANLSDSGGSVSGADAYNMVVGNGAYGPPPPKPLTSMPISGVIQYGNDVLIPGTKAKGVGVDPSTGKVLGSSAQGIYQITNSTLKQYAPRVLGANWQNATYSPENQDKLGEAIFKDHNGSVAALRSQWTSLNKLSDNQVEQIRRMPWSQARMYIAKGETGGVPASSPNTFGANEGATATTDVAAGQGQQIANSIGPVWFKLANDTTDIGTVVDNLANSGSFKGTSKQYLFQHIRDVMDRTGGNAAQAAELLKFSVVAGHSAGDLISGLNLGPRIMDYLRGTPNLAGGRKLDANRVDNAIKQVTSGEALTATENLNRLGRGASQLAIAQARRDAIAQQYAVVKQHFENGDRRLGHQLEVLTGQLAQAQAQLDAVLAAKRGNANNGYQPKDPPKPTGSGSWWDNAMAAIGFGG